MSAAENSSLSHQLQRNRAIAETLEGGDFPVDELEQLQQWQRSRIQQSYADLLADPSSAPAGRFFLSELYGGLGFRERDQALERVLPIMERYLPSALQGSLAQAFELQALSLELDMALARAMRRQGLNRIHTPDYCCLYRQNSQRADRERQIDLIEKLGLSLAPLVKKRLVGHLLRLMHAPAHAAGFGSLQDFLESGFAAFRMLEAPDQFIEIIASRERAVLERLYQGDPDPFNCADQARVQSR